MVKPFELRLTTGELRLLIALVDSEQGHAEASRPIEKSRVDGLKRLQAKLEADLATR